MFVVKCSSLDCSAQRSGKTLQDAIESAKRIGWESVTASPKCTHCVQREDPRNRRKAVDFLRAIIEKANLPTDQHKVAKVMLKEWEAKSGASL